MNESWNLPCNILRRHRGTCLTPPIRTVTLHQHVEKARHSQNLMNLVIAIQIIIRISHVILQSQGRSHHRGRLRRPVNLPGGLVIPIPPLGIIPEDQLHVPQSEVVRSKRSVLPQGPIVHESLHHSREAIEIGDAIQGRQREVHDWRGRRGHQVPKALQQYFHGFVPFFVRSGDVSDEDGRMFPMHFQRGESPVFVPSGETSLVNQRHGLSKCILAGVISDQILRWKEAIAQHFVFLAVVLIPNFDPQSSSLGRLDVLLRIERETHAKLEIASASLRRRR
mmetsp:Transcript_1554/g.2931  ORF Transcript_1554/g.2931 Transcript_1554/m.2931 type:complete len:280 (+) Transcript_1554:595-1434(+)